MTDATKVKMPSANRADSYCRADGENCGEQAAGNLCGAPPSWRLSRRVAKNIYAAFAAMFVLAPSLAIVLGLIASPAAVLAEDAGVLQPAVPKLDTEPVKPSLPRGATLKGNIEHRAKISPRPRNKPKSLNSRITRSEPLSGPLTGSLDNSKNTLSGQAQQPYTLERSVGIIGIKFLKIGQRPPMVNRVFPGTPAYKVGFSVDDAIVAVDGVPTAGLSKDECYDLIVGTPNTPISVTLMHNGSFQKKDMMRMDFNEIPDPMVRRDYLNSL